MIFESQSTIRRHSQQLRLTFFGFNLIIYTIRKKVVDDVCYGGSLNFNSVTFDSVLNFQFFFPIY